MPDWLLHVFNRCNYNDHERKQDLLMARVDQPRRLRLMGASQDLIDFSIRHTRESKHRLRMHGIEWSEYEDRPAAREEN